MALLSLRNWVFFFRYGGHQRFMVCVDLERDCFEKMAEVPHSRVDGQELPVERRVTGLGGEELAAVESDGGGALRGHLL